MRKSLRLRTPSIACQTKWNEQSPSNSIEQTSAAKQRYYLFYHTFEKRIAHINKIIKLTGVGFYYLN